jgi:hypothetical protein
VVTPLSNYGVAWGTVVPNLIVQFFFWPRYICKLMDMPVRSYLWQSWARPALAAIPFGLACYATDRYWVATHLFQFFLQIAAILPLFVLGLVIFFWKEFAWQSRNTFGRRLRTSSLENNLANRRPLGWLGGRLSLRLRT